MIEKVPNPTDNILPSALALMVEFMLRFPKSLILQKLCREYLKDEENAKCRPSS